LLEASKGDHHRSLPLANHWPLPRLVRPAEKSKKKERKEKKRKTIIDKNFEKYLFFLEKLSNRAYHFT